MWGGPLREFLTLCMKQFADVSNAFFGDQYSLCFSGSTDTVLNKTYRKLGQLVGLSIIYLGRGPKSLHPAIVRAIFDIEQPSTIEPIDDAKISSCLQKLEIGDYDDVYELEINPNGKTRPELKRMCLLSYSVFNRFAAIDQFKSGVRSISSILVNSTSYGIMRHFFEHSTVTHSFNDISSMIHYPQMLNLQVGSNEHSRFQDALSEFEIFLTALEGNDIIVDENPATLQDFLMFVIGSERIPPHGFEKALEIQFDDITLPIASTCGLNATFPYTGISDAFRIALQFGGGFGNI